ncbi:MAG: proline dehydrogenase family protein [Agromyces sp.]
MVHSTDSEERPEEHPTAAFGAETLGYPGLPLADEASIPAEAIALVERWLARALEQPRDAAGERLAGVLRDPNGLPFTVGFIDGVIRPEDPAVAGRALAELAPLIPAFLPAWMRLAIRVGGWLGPVLPWLVVPIARRTLRRMVGHLVLDASEAKLGAAIARLRGSGHALNLNLLGEAVLGEAEAARRLAGTRAFLERDDVEYVSIKVSSVVSQLSMWDFDGAVARVIEALTPLYRTAASATTPKFINLDMEEYKDLDLTIAVFQGLLDRPEFQRLEAGIVLQAYLPDALGAMQRLAEWAHARRAAGGAAIKVRLVKGANLAMERVDAELHGWPLATVASKRDADANYKRVLDWALTPERVDAIRLGIAGHNLFDIAFAWLLAGHRGVRSAIDFEMLLGMAPQQAAAVSADVGPLRLYTPVVHPDEFDVAIAYLIRRLEENATAENFMSAVFELSSHRELFERERDRFLDSIGALAAEQPPQPNRGQDRVREREELLAKLAAPAVPAPTQSESDGSLTTVLSGLERGSLEGEPAGPGATPGFRNAPDTDPAIAANRAWGRDILHRARRSTIGSGAALNVVHPSELEFVLERTRATGREWGARPAAERAALLHRAGIAIEARRAELIEVMASEAGKTIAEADAEVSEAVDFAHYYAERARELEAVPGARFQPSAVTVVTPPWNFPVAIPAGGVLSALAAGSGVVMKPASLAVRCAGVLSEALWEAGIDRDLYTLVTLNSHALGAQLVASPIVDRVILTGSYETAAKFRSFRPDLRLLAETSGKNAIVVTPSADLDLAVADIARSAFGHAGQKCSAASLVILVGSVGRSARFERQLRDAVSSLRVGPPTDPASQMGPLIQPASGKLLSALLSLGEGESWLLEPRQRGEKLWTPGIRSGVQPGSPFHLTEYFGPVLGIMRARTLDEAIAWQNRVSYGLTAGLHSLDGHEIAQWIDEVEAGNLYVNRGTTGAIVQRQPFGGWKRSSVGAGAKAGGPNTLLGLGSWAPTDTAPSDTLHLRGISRRASDLIEAVQPALDFADFEVLRQAALSDAIAWQAEYGRATDHSRLTAERNILRYRPVPVAVRIADDVSLRDAIRAVSAALASHAPFTISTGCELPQAARTVLRARAVPVRDEGDAEWWNRLRTHGAAALRNEADLDWPARIDRIRLISAGGLSETAVAEATAGSPDIAVWANPLTPSGRIELLPYLREQAISLTAHRFGAPNRAILDLRFD